MSDVAEAAGTVAGSAGPAPAAGQVDDQNVESIGVLLVHGIGEQKRFEHLQAEVRHLAEAVAHHVAGAGSQATIDVSPGASSPVGAEKECWRADGGPVVTVTVKDAQNPATPRLIKVCFHEVWWADLDEPDTLGAQFRFWSWGLSMWAKVGFDQEAPAGQKGQMAFPNALGRSKWWVHQAKLRIRLLLVATLFALATFTIGLWNILMKRFRFKGFPISRILTSYLGDVRLYAAEPTRDGGPLSDRNRPPRTAVRRRMVNGLVDMATGGYDRWYIVAHSLGTVVAFNGLEETAHCLPNYLSQERWMALPGRLKHDIGRPGIDWPPGYVPATGKMLPPRPAWLGDRAVIDRQVLFEKLRGVVFYGSPLDKFACLWPMIVPRNRMAAEFPELCEWINIWDPTDPVSGSLDFFNPPTPHFGGRAALSVTNVAYAASWFLLYSHLCYLKPGRFRRDSLVDALAKWISSPGGAGNFVGVLGTRPFNNSLRWPKKGAAALWMRHGAVWVQWTLAAILIALGAAAIYDWIMNDLITAKISDFSISNFFATLPFDSISGFDDWADAALKTFVASLTMPKIAAFIGDAFRWAGATSGNAVWLACWALKITFLFGIVALAYSVLRRPRRFLANLRAM